MRENTGLGRVRIHECRLRNDDRLHITLVAKRCGWGEIGRDAVQLDKIRWIELCLVIGDGLFLI